MGLAPEMRNLSEDILASFKQRIRENEELVNDVQKTLDGFRKDHQEMAAALRSGLDKDEKNRLKEADILMKEMIKDRKNMAAALRSGLDNDEKNRMKEFVALMKSINEDISGIFTYTHDLLVKSEAERLQEFAILIKSINEEVLRIFSYTHDMLAKFDKEHMEMSVELRKGLDKGEVERLKEFNVVMKGICNDVKNLKKAVAGLLGDYAQDRGEASAAWKKMSDILAQLRKTGVVTPPKEVVRKAEKKEVKMEIPVKAEKETPVEEVKEIPVKAVKETPVKAEPKPVVLMTLEEKILDFINNHPEGVRISEMEEPLGKTRMKLGFIAKNLLNEGKVLKIETIYYPKTKIER